MLKKSSFLRKIVLPTVILTAMGPFTESRADGLRLARIFTDNAVLQRQSETRIWGWASPGSTVTLKCGWSVDGYSALAGGDGRWEALIPTGSGGFEPQWIKLTDGKDEITLRNILIGEVWLASGQSNMEVKLAPDPEWNLYVEGAEQVMSEETTSYIRTFNVARDFSFDPLDDLSERNTGWITADSEDIGNFSAVGFFFARQIQEQIDVPVGIICSAFGGTPIQSWLPIDIAGEESIYSELMEQRRMQIEREGLGRDAAVERMREWFDNSQHPLTAGISFDEVPEYAVPVELPGLLQAHAGERYGGSVLYRELVIEQQSDVRIWFPKIDRNARIYWNGELVYENLLPSEAFDAPEIVIPSQKVRRGTNLIAVNLLNYLWNGGMSGEPEEFFAMASTQEIPLAGRWFYLPTFDMGDADPMPLEGRADEFIVSSLYNAMVYPLIKYNIRGVLWQQGEANVDEAEDYPRMLSDLAISWRKESGKALPFYYVELPPWPYSGAVNTEAAYMRLKMAEAASFITDSGMAVTIDTGTYDNIHSPKKKPVGERLAFLALKGVYGYDLKQDYPRVDKIHSRDGVTVLEMGNVHENLSYQGEPLFEVSTDGSRYHPVPFELSGANIILRTEGEPVKGIRYNYLNFPRGNIFNSEGLPLDNFVTEQNHPRGE